MLFRNFLSNLDWLLLILVIMISTIGLITVYSASHSLGLGNFYFYRQLTWFGLGLLVMIGTAMIDYRLLCRFALPLHLSAIILLIITLFFGVGGQFSNAPRWLKIGSFNLQTSELVKFTIILIIAQYFKESRKFGKFNLKVIVWLGSLIGIPFLLIVRQPDLGTALLFLFTSFMLIYFSGLRYRLILGVTLLALLLTPVIWQYGIAEYQKDRILTMFNPNADQLGKGYHINQSIIAIGSGGKFGKGYLQGTQAQLNFLPARHTDFIFSLFAEEWGFAGSISLIILYSALLLHIINSIGKLKYLRENIIIAGVSAILCGQTLINLGMVMRLLPVVGIPLPLFSYGGSSMITTMFGIGLLMSVYQRRFEGND
ncbi:MAG: rod shape-determining protein RodA [SAR324 cluster bacterium]|nr:rod shape-determining protein RodA [SAR324 cluster bacterium]